MARKNVYPGNAPTRAVRLDDEDAALLAAAATYEKLSLSDTMRRAIRHYAKALGVAPQEQKASV